MVTIFDNILFLDKKIMIIVKLPKFAIYDIEVFVWEVPKPHKDNRNEKDPKSKQ